MIVANVEMIVAKCGEGYGECGDEYRIHIYDAYTWGKNDKV
jgi:hypothetical protein